MKFVAITLLAFIAAVFSAPISISNNNIGDIVTVGIDVNLDFHSQIDQNIVNVILALLNQKAIVVGKKENDESVNLKSSQNWNLHQRQWKRSKVC